LEPLVVEPVVFGFGVGSGFTINYISKFTTDVVYGFDTLEELQKRWTDDNIIVTPDILPDINNNVDLIIGSFFDTLEEFIIKKNMLISFIHIDLNSYRLTLYILDIVKRIYKSWLYYIVWTSY
jgi:hypothetical protein